MSHSVFIRLSFFFFASDLAFLMTTKKRRGFHSPLVQDSSLIHLDLGFYFRDYSSFGKSESAPLECTELSCCHGYS